MTEVEGEALSSLIQPGAGMPCADQIAGLWMRQGFEQNAIQDSVDGRVRSDADVLQVRRASGLSTNRFNCAAGDVQRCTPGAAEYLIAVNSLAAFRLIQAAVNLLFDVHLLLAHRDRVAQVHRPAAFTDVVAVPGRDLDFDVALNHTLAAQARFQREPGGHVQAVGFLIGHLRKVLHALVNDHVAGGAGAVAAAGVFQVDSEVQADVQDRFGEPVFLIWQLARFELHGLPVDGELRHNLL